MAKIRINWNLVIVLILAISAVAITGISLRKYHRQQRAEAGLETGLKAYEEGQWKEAASSLGRYLAIYPDDVDVLMKYAQSQVRVQPFKRQNLAQAINAYRIVLRRQDHEQAAEEVINLYLQFGMPAEAELIAQRFVTKSDRIVFRQSLASALVDQRKYSDALSILMDMIRNNPDQIYAFQLLGEIAEKRPELTSLQAGEWFDRAVSENPAAAQAYLLRSAYLTKQDQIDAAIADLEQAEQCDLSSVNDRLNLAAAWIQHRRYEKARGHLEQVKSLEPSNVDLWYLWARLASETEDPEQMLAVADEGLQILGESNYSFLPIATELLIQAGQLERARGFVATLNDVEADRGMILYLQGLIDSMTMNWASAIQNWQHAIQLGFTSEMVYLNLADTLDQINNRPMAIQVLRQYVSHSESSFKGHLQLAKLFARDKHWQQAMEQATAAVQLNPVSLEARVMYLRCQIELSDPVQPVEMTVLKDSIQRLLDARDTVAGRMLLFHMAVRRNETAEADDVIRGIEETFGESEQTLTARAGLLMLQDDIDGCVSLLEQKVQDYPDSSEMVKLLAWAYSRERRFDKCRELLQTGIAKTQNAYTQRKYRLWLAEALLLEGKRQDAVALYRQIAGENSSDIYVRRQLLDLQQEAVGVEQAQQWIDEIKTAEGEDGWQWKYEQARLWSRSEEQFERRYAQIVRMLNENLMLNPDDQTSRILLAFSHERAGNVQLALSLYQDAMAKQANNLDLIIAAVGTMYRAEEYRQAQDLLMRVTESGVWDPRLAQYELQNSLRIGQRDDAIDVLEKMIDRSPQDFDARLSLALLQIRDGDYASAENQIRHVLAAKPDSIAANAALAELYIGQDKKAEALQVCESYLKGHDTLAAHAMYCQVLLNTGDIQGVAEGIERVRNKFGTEKNAQLIISRLYQSIGNTDKAMEVMDQLLTESEEDFQVQRQAALLFLDQADTTRRIRGKALLEKALQQSPHDVSLRLKNAWLLIQENNTVSFAKASVLLNKLVKEYPQLEEAWHALGQLSLMENKPVQAMDYALRGLYYLPQSKPLLLLKAQAESRHSPISAISTLNLLHQEDPKDKTVVMMLCENYRKAERYQNAISLLENALNDADFSESLDLRREQFVLLYESGRKEEAQAAYRELVNQTDNERVLLSWVELLADEKHPQAIETAYLQWAERYPDRAEPLAGSVITILHKMDHPEKNKIAEAIVNWVLTRNPNSADGCYAKAMLYHLNDRRNDAISWYEKALSLNPQNVIAMNNLAWLLCTERADFQQALGIAQQGLTMYPSYVDLIDTRGVIYMKMGEYEKAAGDFERCEQMYFDMNPNKTTSVFRLGKCLIQLKKDREALVELFKAKDLNTASGGLSSNELAELERMIQNITKNVS